MLSLTPWTGPSPRATRQTNKNGARPSSGGPSMAGGERGDKRLRLRLHPNTHTCILYSMHFVVCEKYSASEYSVRILQYGRRFRMRTTAKVNHGPHYAIPQCNRSLVTNEEEMADPTPPTAAFYLCVCLFNKKGKMNFNRLFHGVTNNCKCIIIPKK